MLHQQCKIFHSFPYLSEFLANLFFTHLLVVSSSTMLMAFSSHFPIPVWPPDKLVDVSLQLRALPASPIVHLIVYWLLHTFQQSSQIFQHSVFLFLWLPLPIIYKQKQALIPNLTCIKVFSLSTLPPSACGLHTESGSTTNLT
jgi:hypothetical protein